MPREALPPLRAMRRHIANAASSVTRTISSIKSRSSVSGMKPGAVPMMRCGWKMPFDMTGELAGSTATSRIAGLWFPQDLSTPQSVPPVPKPAPRMSIVRRYRPRVRAGGGIMGLQVGRADVLPDIEVVRMLLLERSDLPPANRFYLSDLFWRARQYLASVFGDQHAVLDPDADAFLREAMKGSITSTTPGAKG